ncbi:MAG: hypothetical protein FD127_4278, partial [Acidimicrobiaceae bacterium]
DPTQDASDVAATTTDSWTVLTPANLAITAVDTTPNYVTQGQTSVAVTMSVTNTGGATANIDALNLDFNGSLTGYAVTTGAYDGALAGGATTTIAFTVDVDAAAPLGLTTIDGAVSGADANSGAVTIDGDAAIVDQWTVQAPANLVITALAASPTQVSTGQSFQATVTVQNVGTAAATIEFSDESLVFSNGGLIASGTTQATTVTLAANASSSFTFTVVSGASSGVTTLTSATFSATDTNSGLPVPVNANNASPKTITIQGKASLSITAISASATQVSTSQMFTSTVTVQNTGEAAINFTIENLVFSDGNLTAPQLNQTVTLVGGDTVGFEFSVTAGAASGVTTITSATFTAVDANSLNGLVVASNVASPVSVLVQQPAAIRILSLRTNSDHAGPDRHPGRDVRHQQRRSLGRADAGLDLRPVLLERW